MVNKIRILVILLFFFLPVGYAQQLQQPNSTGIFCPPPEALTRQGLIWSGPDNWKSYNGSFVKQIGGFIGAQWIGINVGKVICIYRGEAGFDFPVTLERAYTADIPEPMDGNWGAYYKGVKNCRADSTSLCPFAKPVKPQEPTDNLYQVIESLKKAH